LTHIALHTRFPQIPHAKLLRSTELLGTHVLPRVRAAYAAVDGGPPSAASSPMLAAVSGQPRLREVPEGGPAVTR
jgi:hypothetical protein